MKRDALENFLKEKKTANEATLARFNREARLKKWQDQVASLYRHIRDYLGKSEKEGYAKIFPEQMTLTEELLGSYQIDRMIIDAGGERVIIAPRGTFIIGAFGRCDMKGEGGTAMLVLLAPGDKPGVSFKEMPSTGDADLKMSALMDKPADIASAQWHFASRAPRWNYWPLSKETFTQALQEVMRK